MGEPTSDYFIVEDSESFIDYVPNFEDAEHARIWLDAVDVFIEKHSNAEAAAPARKQSACIRTKLPELAMLEEEMKSREEPVYAGHSGIYRKPKPDSIDYSEINALKTELRFLLLSLDSFLNQIREWRENKHEEADKPDDYWVDLVEKPKLHLLDSIGNKYDLHQDSSKNIARLIKKMKNGEKVLDNEVKHPKSFNNPKAFFDRYNRMFAKKGFRSDCIYRENEKDGRYWALKYQK